MRSIQNHIIFRAIRSIWREPRHLLALGSIAGGHWRTKSGADSNLYRFVDRFHREASTEIPQNVECLNNFANLFPFGENKQPSKGTALVFLLRGQAILHNVHHLLIARCLVNHGYHVKLVVCGGRVERCGVGQVREPFDLPAVSCFNCRESLAKLGDLQLDVLRLEATPEEPQIIESSIPIPGWTATEISDVLEPSLLRYYQGDVHAMSAAKEEFATRKQALRRFTVRAQQLFAKERPKVVCLFNGLTFPESAIGKVARDEGITVLYAERGVLPNSIFISKDVAASHYRAESLWRDTSGQITEADIAWVESFVASRRSKNIDPLGIERVLETHGASVAKYEELAREPYILFFASVVHDTAAMQKDRGLGNVLEVIDLLCRIAIEKKLRLVVRAHPDERRSHNPSRYPIEQYIRDLGYADSVRCLDSTEEWNPYLLAENASHVVVFNGTIGMECPVLGIPVINLGKSHYSEKGFTYDPSSLEELTDLLSTPLGPLELRVRREASRYLFFYLKLATLDLSALIEERPGFRCAMQTTRDSEAERQEQILAERVAYLLNFESACYASSPGTVEAQSFH